MTGNAKNKVKFGLKNVHYAVATVGEEGVTYAAPVPIPGAVNLSLSASGDTTPFYADDGKYFDSTANNGYEGDLEIALVPDTFRTDVLGESLDAKKVMFEKTDAETKPIALLFEFAGDKHATRHVLYFCSVNRPNVESGTIAESKEVKTETLSITASAAPGHTVVKAKSTAETDSTTYEGWYDAVYVETAVEGA